MLSFGCRSGIIAVSAVLLLGGCARTGASNWTKPSVDVSQRADDFSACVDDTRQATQQNYAIDQDIAASRKYDWHNQGTTTEETANLEGSDADKSDSILAACMMSKGYAAVQ